VNQITIPPDHCRNLDEIRAGMDAIERGIIVLIARRVPCVRAAAAFKTVGSTERFGRGLYFSAADLFAQADRAAKAYKVRLPQLSGRPGRNGRRHVQRFRQTHSVR
jgi:hypothetical protein